MDLYELYLAREKIRLEEANWRSMDDVNDAAQRVFQKIESLASSISDRPRLTLEERVARFPHNPTLLDLMARRDKLDTDIFMVLRMCEASEE